MIEISTDEVEKAIKEIEQLINTNKIEQGYKEIEKLESTLNASNIEDKIKYSIKLALLRVKLLTREGKYKEGIELLNQIYTTRASKTNNIHLKFDVLREKARLSLNISSYQDMNEALDLVAQYAEEHRSELTKEQYTNHKLFVLNIRGLYYWRIGELQQAIKLFTEFLELVKQIPDIHPIYLSTAYHNLGLIHYEVGNFEQSLFYYQKTLEVAEKSGEDDLELSKTISSIGFVYKALGQYEKALEHFTKAYEIRLKSGSTRDITRVLDNVGEINMLLGNYQKAEEIIKQCIINAKEVGDTEELAWAYDLLGQLYKRRGDYRLALDFYNVSMQYNKDLQQKNSIAKNLMLISEIYLEQGELDLAIECIEQSITYFKAINNKLLIAEAQYYLAKIMFELSEYEKAEQLLKTALEIFDEIGNFEISALVLFELVCFYVWTDKFQLARSVLDTLQAISEKKSTKEQISNLYRLAQSIYNRNEQRLIEKAKAQEYLYKFVQPQSNTLEHSKYMIALLELTKSLIDEYALTKSKVVYSEIMDKLEQISFWVEKEDSKKLLVAKNLLEAEMSILDNKIKDARSLLIETRSICKHYNLKHLSKKIDLLLSNISSTFGSKIQTTSQRVVKESTKETKIHVIAYKWDELGFFPFVEYGNIQLSDLAKQKYGTFVSIATSLGSEYHSGLFGPLPFSEHKDMESIVFAQMVKDPQIKDYRLENSNYLLVVLVFPRHNEQTINKMREQIKTVCLEFFSPEIDINKISTDVVSAFYTQIMNLLNQ